MTAKWNLVFVRLGGDGEKCISRQKGVNLDQISAANAELVNCLAPFCGRGNGKEVRAARFRQAVENRASGHDKRSQPGATSGVLAQLLDFRQRHGSSHVSNTKDAIGHEHGKHAVQSFWEYRMDVHVPQSG